MKTAPGSEDRATGTGEDRTRADMAEGLGHAPARPARVGRARGRGLAGSLVRFDRGRGDAGRSVASRGAAHRRADGPADPPLPRVGAALRHDAEGDTPRRPRRRRRTPGAHRARHDPGAPARHRRPRADHHARRSFPVRAVSTARRPRGSRRHRPPGGTVRGDGTPGAGDRAPGSRRPMVHLHLSPRSGREGPSGRGPHRGGPCGTLPTSDTGPRAGRRARRRAGRTPPYAAPAT